MQITGDAYIFTLDSFDSEGCSGWYIRKDSIKNELKVIAGGKTYPLEANIIRPDVRAAGYDHERCGFEIQFSPKIAPGEMIKFLTMSGDPIYSMTAIHEEYKPDALNMRMLQMVEPFVEMDIARVRKALMEGRIYGQYHDMYKAILNNLGEKNLKKELVDILADMKTTIHLLCAAYLDHTRYKDPEYLLSLPQFAPDTTRQFSIDMRGDITGSQWSEPSERGRCLNAGVRASLLLPSPGAGNYKLDISISNIIGIGRIKNLRIFINDKEQKLNIEGTGKFCKARSQFNIPECGEPFLAIHFQITETKSDSSELPCSLCISTLTFIREQQ